MTARLLNHSRAIANDKLPAEVQPSDLIYLSVEAPDPETPEQIASRLLAQSGNLPPGKVRNY